MPPSRVHTVTGASSVCSSLHFSGAELTFSFPSLFSQTADEGSTVSCVIERMRGSLDHVYVNYNVTLDSSNSELPAHQDFVNATGAVLFMPGQRSEVCAMCSIQHSCRFIGAGKKPYLNSHTKLHCTINISIIISY